MIANNYRPTTRYSERRRGVAVAEMERFKDFNAPLCSWTSSMARLPSHVRSAFVSLGRQEQCHI